VESELQASFRHLADQDAGRAGVRAAAPHHQEAGQHACGCADTVAAELLKTNVIGSEKQHNRVSAESTLTTASSSEEPESPW